MSLHPGSSKQDSDDKLKPVAPSGSTTPTGPARAAQFILHEQRGGLRRGDLAAGDPMGQFAAWLAHARGSGAVAHPETCTLSTAALPSGRVSARVVYLKEMEARDGGGGFVVYSNFGSSRKARDLAANPWAALTFWWEGLERQVRVEGRAARLPPAESQAYFASRVRGSRLGAWASRQSAVLPPAGPADDGREVLQRWVREAEERFDGVEEIPCPDFWGGLRIVPESIEFWQGRENRLHDRFVYERVRGEDGKEEWTLQRLSP